MDDWRAIFVFLLCSVSSSTVCLYTACKLYAHAPSLLLHFGWISSTTHSPGIWSKECFPMMPRKMGGKDSFGTCGRGLSLCCHSFVYNPPSGGKKKDQREEKCSYQGNCNLQSFLFMWTWWGVAFSLCYCRGTIKQKDLTQQKKRWRKWSSSRAEVIENCIHVSYETDYWSVSPCPAHLKHHWWGIMVFYCVNWTCKARPG